MFFFEKMKLWNYDVFEVDNNNLFWWFRTSGSDFERQLYTIEIGATRNSKNT